MIVAILKFPQLQRIAFLIAFHLCEIVKSEIEHRLESYPFPISYVKTNLNSTAFQKLCRCAHPPFPEFAISIQLEQRHGGRP